MPKNVANNVGSSLPIEQFVFTFNCLGIVVGWVSPQVSWVALLISLFLSWGVKVSPLYNVVGGGVSFPFSLFETL